MASAEIINLPSKVAEEPVSEEVPDPLAEQVELAAVQVQPAPFWSVLSLVELQSYTWYGLWSPPGLASLAPPLETVGTLGKDFLLGTDGSELLDGLSGEDLVLAQGGNDWILGGPGDDALLGEAGNDIMLGGDGDDYLEGGTGHDWLSGDAGVDTLTGWQGNDVFAFFVSSPSNGSQRVTPSPVEPTAANGPDTVTDFNLTEDLILIGGLLTEQPAVGFNPFTAYVQLTQTITGTLVAVNQVDGLGNQVTTDIALLTGVVATELSVSNFVFA